MLLGRERWRPAEQFKFLVPSRATASAEGLCVDVTLFGFFLRPLIVVQGPHIGVAQTKKDWET